MDKMIWLSLLPPLIAIAIAVWSKKIIPSLLIGLLAGSYFLHATLTGGFETAVDYIVKTLTDKENLQVLLFLYLFSGLISLIKKSGGIKAFSDIAEKHIKSKRGVFFTLWALIPVTFIDCGFRVVGAGSITRSLAEKNKIAKERLAFMLNNTAAPIVEMIPIATTFVGFNVAIISQGLKAEVLLKKAPPMLFGLKLFLLNFSALRLFLSLLFPSFFNLKNRLKSRSNHLIKKKMVK